MNIRTYCFSGLSAIALSILTSSCGNSSANRTDVLFSSDDFTVTTDSVIQGDYVAKALSDYSLVTNYKSPETSGISSLLHFRLSLNSRDNELRPGIDHQVLVGTDTVFTFGDCPATTDESLKAKAHPLSPDTQWTLKVNMAPVLDSFKRYGYYVAAGNDTIYKDDFKGVWVAGSVVPLNWDFENLYGKDNLKLRPLHPGDSIYQATLTLNPPTKTPADPTGWNIDGPVAGMPQYHSDQMLMNALYNMAASEVVSDLRPDSTYRAGREWDGVWTRDVSYSIYLGLAFTDPYGSWNSLKAKLKDSPRGKVIVQDTGTGGSWPVSSDRIVWAMAAWEVYKATGDRAILNEAFEAIDNTLHDDMWVVWNPAYSLMHGEQSYLDWREQTYPKWMQPKDIYESMCLGTNVMYAQAFRVRNAMARELNLKDDDSGFETMDSIIAKAVNDHLWMDNLGYFSEYLYGGVYPIQSTATDNLGQALSIIFDVATPEMGASIIANTPYTPYGISSVYPQMPEIRPYHNNAVWPFVQAYWNLASARVGNMQALEKGIASLMRAAAMFATHKELFVADNGDYRGTAINSDAQLWSCTGFTAMVYRIIAGMSLEPDGIRFSPCVPAYFSGDKTLSSLKYRNADVTVNIHGTGNNITRFAINDSVTDSYFLPADTEGKVVVDITLDNKRPAPQKINNQPQMWMPKTPVVEWTTDTCATILNQESDICYTIHTNSSILEQVCTPAVSYLPTPGYSVLDIVPVRMEHYQGFTCLPHEHITPGSQYTVSANDFGVATGTNLITNRSIAANYVETTATRNSTLNFHVNVEQGGDYFLDVRYANGSGPINTENKCAIRMLYVNGNRAGAIVMPQRGIGEWISTGNSNMLPVRLNSGDNTLSLRLEVPNMNADGVNTALIRSVRIIRK